MNENRSGPSRLHRVRAVVLAAVVGAGIVACTTGSTGKPRVLPQVGSIDFTQLRDGQYEGYYDYEHLADARVRVIVSGGRVSSIKLLKHFHFPFLSGAKVADRIVDRQSLAVDAVSGATGSSTVVRKAVEIALRQALPAGAGP